MFAHRRDSYKSKERRLGYGPFSRRPWQERFKNDGIDRRTQHPVCATFCGGNESDTTQLSKTLDEARRIHGNLSHFTELLADKGYDSRANRLTCLRHGLRPLILERTRRRRNPPPNGAPAANQRRQARPHVCPPLTPEELARVARRRNAVERCFA